MADKIQNWLPVCDHYEVSDFGQVWSHYKSRLLTIGNRHGYGTAKVHGTLVSVHRLVLTAFVGPCPEGMLGLHRDDDKRNNALANLYWGTPSENQYDRVRNGIHHGSIKTHCKRGHELTGDNLMPSALKYGKRQCWTCNRASQAEWARKRRAS